MTSGFLYLLANSKYNTRFLVSVASLRQFHDEPIAVMTNDLKHPAIAEANERFGDVTPILVDLPAKRNSCYVAKSSMGRISPFDRTIFLDADTLIMGRVDPLWPENDEWVLTQFSDWNTKGNLIGGRCRWWEHICPDLVKFATDTAWPAVNTGIMSFSKRTTAMPEWEKLTHSYPSFIGDEIAANLLFPHHPHRILSDVFNQSPKYGMNKNCAIIWHGHGHSKHLMEPMFTPWREMAERIGVFDEVVV